MFFYISGVTEGRGEPMVGLIVLLTLLLIELTIVALVDYIG